MSDEGQLADLEPWTQEQLLAFVDAVFRTIQERLVDPPVEPRGILSRLEHHCARLLREQNEIANHDAQITAARHEFLRDWLVSSHNALVSKLDNLTQEWRANYTRVMGRLDGMQSALDKQTGALSRIEDALDAAGRNAANRQAEILRRMPFND